MKKLKIQFKVWLIYDFNGIDDASREMVETFDAYDEAVEFVYKTSLDADAYTIEKVYVKL